LSANKDHRFHLIWVKQDFEGSAVFLFFSFWREDKMERRYCPKNTCRL